MILNSLNYTLNQSDHLDEVLSMHLEGIDHAGTVRAGLTRAICSVAFEHGHSLRQLMALGNHTSAVALLRLQFESLVRAIWVLHVANESWLDKLSAPLTVAAEQAAKNAPSLDNMMDAIEAPLANPRAGEMIKGFYTANWKSLNSFVHAGIHPVARVMDGYVDSFLMQIIRNSNALAVMAAATLTSLSGNQPQMKALTQIQLEFKECLPQLLSS